jgi:hypothetical protein
MLRHHSLFPLALLLVTLLASACAQSVSAPDAIEAYLKAKIAGDERKLTSLSCKAWEMQAALDAAPFRSVDARLDNLSCRVTGQEGDATLVVCEGTLIIQYRGEDPRQQPLAGTVYRAIKEDGEWKMCGEQ